MKTKALIFTLSGLFYFFFCQPAPGQNPPSAFPLKFEYSEFNFGEIGELGGKVYHSFPYQNLSSDTVWIVSAVGFCHCTTGDFPLEGIPPKKSGFITVTYDPKGRPWDFDSGIEVKLKGKSTSLELKVKGKTVGGAETVRFSPVEYIQKFQYNEKSLQAEEADFQSFVKKLVPILEKYQRINIQIESSASHVPTKTFSNNTDLTVQRAKEARSKMLDLLATYHADLSRVHFLEDNTLVQGPAYTKDFKNQMAKYLPFQYVKIRVF
jgi:hypothetical protein